MANANPLPEVIPDRIYLVTWVDDGHRHSRTFVTRGFAGNLHDRLRRQGLRPHTACFTFYSIQETPDGI